MGQASASHPRMRRSSARLGTARRALPRKTARLIRPRDLSDRRLRNGWIPCNGLDDFYRICDGAGDALTYFGAVT